MYFLTVLLLLLLSKLSYSMESPQEERQETQQERTQDGDQVELQEQRIQNEPLEEDLVPFIHPYIYDVKKFLEIIKLQIPVTITGLLRLALSSLKRKDHNDGCNTIEDRLVSEAPCKMKCSGQNRIYIKFMNINVSSQLRVSFVDRSTHRVKLNPIDSNTGSCVKRNKYFECLCKTNYQIMISSSLTTVVNNSIEKVNNISNNNGTEMTKEEYFSALLFILKFHPHAAPLFLAFLFHKYLVKSQNVVFDHSEILNLDVEQNLGNAVHVVPEDVDGRVEYIGQLVKKEEELFQIIITKVSLGSSCDLQGIYNHYLDKVEVVALNLLFCMLGIITFELSFGKKIFNYHNSSTR